ncbi:MAG: hypothetical protein ACXW13_01050 [Burkholderiaceae bacterium]
MKRNTMGFFAAAVVAMVGISGPSAAQIRAPDEAPPEAVSRYVVGTRLGYITCSNKYRDYVEKYARFALVNEGQNTVTGSPPSDEDYRACVQETLVKGRGMYGPASKQTPTTASKAALKEYQTAWEDSLSTLGRAGGEKPAEYRTRQSKVQARLDELQRKVEAQGKKSAR